MKKVFVVALLLALTTQVLADVYEGQAAYIGGTITSVKEGVIGRLDTTQQDNLVFEHASGKVTIPYAKISEWEYSKKVAHHWGVLPTVAIVLIKHRQRRHFFRLAYHDEAGIAQAGVFEVPKQMPQTLIAVLRARAPQFACKASHDNPCAKW